MHFLSLTFALVWGALLPRFTIEAGPTASSSSVTTSEDIDLSFGLTGAGAGSLTYTITTPPTHGAALLSRSRVTYDPADNFNGTDSLQFQVQDGTGAVSNYATVTITVTAVNDAPTVATQSITASTAVATAVAVAATDVDGDALTCAITLAPAHGSTRFAGCTVTYTSTPAYTGPDSFIYTASDGVLTSAEATVNVTVSPPNRAPTVSALTAAVDEDVPTTITLSGADPDGDALTYSVTTAPVHGDTDLVGDVVTYTPDPNYSGPDTFKYSAVDARGLASAQATVSVTVTGVNDIPVSAAVSATTNEDTTVAVRMSASDPDARSALIYTVVTDPLHGSVVPSTYGSVNYIPEGDFSGTDTFTYQASDGISASPPATATVTVNAADDAPRVVNVSGATITDRPLILYADFFDPDYSSASPTLVALPDRGTVSLVDDMFLYTPEAGFYGSDTFSYYVTDDTGLASGVASVRVNVHPTPTPGRAEMPQFGLNQINFGLNAEPGEPLSTASSQYQPELIYDDFESLGIHTFRQLQKADLVWSQVEPSYGNFADVAAEEVLSSADLDPVATLFSIQYASPTPPWCTDSADFQKYMGRDAYDYLDHVIDNYGDYVRYYEIGNEVYHWVASYPPQLQSGIDDMPTCFPADGYWPDEQGIFLEEAARYVKAALPDAIITLPAINASDDLSNNWLREVIAATADTEWFDVVGYHSYVEWTRLYTMRPALRTLVEELSINHKMIKMTEGGSSSDPSKTKKTDYPNSEETQASDIFRMPLITWGYGDASFIWHSYVPAPTDEEGGGYSCEVLNQDGTWRPAGYTIQLMTSNLLPFGQVADLSAPTVGVYMYKVTRTDGAVRWVMWGGRKVRVPPGVTEWTSVFPDLDGNFTWSGVAAGDSLNLEETPILLR